MERAKPTVRKTICAASIPLNMVRVRGRYSYPGSRKVCSRRTEAAKVTRLKAQSMVTMDSSLLVVISRRETGRA